MKKQFMTPSNALRTDQANFNSSACFKSVAFAWCSVCPALKYSSNLERKNERVREIGRGEREKRREERSEILSTDRERERDGEKRGSSQAEAK